MMLVVIVALRIVNLTSDEASRSFALDILHKCRQIMLGWTERLSKLLERTDDNDQIQKVQQNLLKIGLLGKLTYSLNSRHIQKSFDNAKDVKH